MLSLRKLFLAFAVLLVVSATAFAQVPPLNCTAQAAGTNSIRAEGVTELTGDILIFCFNGTPTTLGAPVPQVNIQIFSSPSINITSRLLSGDFNESLLFIDEPAPLSQTLCGSTTAPESAPGVCSANTGTGTGIGTYAGTSNRPNAWQGRRVGANSVIWQGIQFDPPGTQTTRTIRITNVRVNASQLGVPSGAQSSVALVISTSPSGVGGPAIPPIQLPITNPAPTVAIAQNSISFSVRDALSCLQCENANKDFAGDPTKTLAGTTKCDGVALRLRYDELFPTAYRRRNNSDAAADGNSSPTPTSQDNFSQIFQTETGFYKDGTVTPVSQWPTSGFSRGTVAGTGSGTLGLADHGTRLIARFTNVQAGVQVWVETNPTLVNIAATGTTTGIARLVLTDPLGAGPFSAAPQGSNVSPFTSPNGLAQVSVIGGTGQAVWEIMRTDTTAFERFQPRVVFAYVANTAANLPSLGTASANGNLAPISTVSGASSTAPLPRFIDTATSRSLLTINSCRTNILFPFVTNQGGFDTGLAISNTSKDPFGTAVQTGACTINYYGVVGASNVTLAFPSPSITGGEHFVWSLSSGGAVQATAGFQGYVIAQCNFQYGHGYAFISDLGAQRLAQGYLALVMDDALSPQRTGSKSEVLGH